MSKQVNTEAKQPAYVEELLLSGMRLISDSLSPEKRVIYLSIGASESIARAMVIS